MDDQRVGGREGVARVWDRDETKKDDEDNDEDEEEKRKE